MKNKKIIGVFLIGILLLTGCAKTPKLENGQEVFATIDGYKMTADDLYAALKERGGLSVMLDLIDTKIVDKEITDQTGADAYADGQVQMYQEYYGDQFEETLKYYGYNDVETFKDMIKTDYLKQKVAVNYLKSTIKDEDVQKYYDENVYGDQTVRYILVRPAELDSDASDEDKLKAENEALEEAKEIIKKINNGEKIEDLAKELSDDKLSALNGGLMSDFNKDQTNDTFFKAVVALKDGEMTKEPLKDENGYNIILKVSAKEKAKLADVKDEILETLANEELSSSEDALTKTWVKIRDKYKLSIIDTDVKTLYEANYR